MRRGRRKRDKCLLKHFFRVFLLRYVELFEMVFGDTLDRDALLEALFKFLQLRALLVVETPATEEWQLTKIWRPFISRLALDLAEELVATVVGLFKYPFPRNTGTHS